MEKLESSLVEFNVSPRNFCSNPGQDRVLLAVPVARVTVLLVSALPLHLPFWFSSFYISLGNFRESEIQQVA